MQQDKRIKEGKETAFALEGIKVVNVAIDLSCLGIAIIAEEEITS